MQISNAFPSAYLKASDLQGRNVRVIMADVKMEAVGKEKDNKPVLYFQGKDKGMVLNKTNSKKIVGAYGEDTDSWVGCEVELYMAHVEFDGDTVEAIRIRIPPRNGAQQATPAPAMTRAFAPPQPQDDLDDDIPF